MLLIALHNAIHEIEALTPASLSPVEPIAGSIPAQSGDACGDKIVSNHQPAATVPVKVSRRLATK